MEDADAGQLFVGRGEFLSPIRPQTTAMHMIRQ